MTNKNRLIVALDVPNLQSAKKLLEELRGVVSYYKIGMELFTACGWESVRLVREHHADLFLDLKFHDIPNTVARTVESTARLPIKMLTLHLAGGREMVQRAVKTQQQCAAELLLLGVTVLTSLGDQDLRDVGVGATPEAQVMRLAQLGIDCGLGGLVCSPLEIKPLRGRLPASVKLVVPGIRPAGVGVGDDQTRVMTPADAARAGANFIVVGRPIFKASDPVAAAEAILGELSGKG